MSDYFEEFEIKIIGDSRGKMVVIEGYKNIPFDIKRLFYVFGADEKSIRGCHANKKSEFVIICVSGKAKIMISNGIDQKTIALDKPNKAVYLHKMTWKEMFDFSSDAVLLCISNEYYDPCEYISSYDEFKKEIGL